MHSLRRRYKAVVECRQRQDGEAAGIIEKAKVSPKEKWVFSRVCKGKGKVYEPRGLQVRRT